MKKYFLGLIAVICALTLSAFAKPFSNYVFKLLTRPDKANVVTNQANWSTEGAFWGNCEEPANDLACSISVNTSETTYFHTVGSAKILNTFSYADAQNPKEGYLEIAESIGLSPLRIISSITPKHYNTTTSQYETVSLGANLNFFNGDY